MNLRKIMALDKKAAKEAQKAVDEIYKRYSKDMNVLIANEVPKGLTFIMGNGMSWIQDKDGNELANGRAWGMTRGDQDEQLDRISGLQYSEKISGDWSLNLNIKGKKLTPNPKQ